MSDLLIHVSRRAMACEFEVRFPAGQCDSGTEFALESLDLVEALEEQIVVLPARQRNQPHQSAWRPKSRSKWSRRCSICSVWQ